MPNNFKTDEQRQNWNKYNREYSKAHYKNICLKLNRETDKDMIEFLERVGNANFIRNAIKEAMKKEGK